MPKTFTQWCGLNIEYFCFFYGPTSLLPILHTYPYICTSQCWKYIVADTYSPIVFMLEILHMFSFDELCYVG